MDNNAAVLSKVYGRMFEIQEYMSSKEDTTSWMSEALKVHKARWEYLHSPMHAAAYSIDLDPLNIDVIDNLDDHCRDGLFHVMRRVCYRDVLLKKRGIPDPEQREDMLAKFPPDHLLTTPMSSNELHKLSASSASTHARRPHSIGRQ